MFLSCAGKSDSNLETGKNVIQNPEYGSKQNVEPAPFEFELQESISLQLPEDFILSGIDYLTTDQNGNYYFMDYAQSKLISVAPDGSFRWMTGEKGKGPGDFEDVWGILIQDNYILVSNIQSTRHDFFDFDGNFIKSISLPKEILYSSIEDVTESGKLIISSFRMGSFGHNIFIAKLESDSLSILNSFEIDETNGVKIQDRSSTKSSLNIIDDKIITGSLHDYSFSIYNLEGVLIKTIKRSFDKIVRPGMYATETSSTLYGFGDTSAPYKINDELYLATTSWPTNVTDPDQFTKRVASGIDEKVDFMNSIDFFDAKWNLLYSIESEGYDPEFGKIDMVKDGVIFTSSAEPFPTVYKYKIKTKN
ncbi:MAG: hypothetical protein WC967_05350 [Balneolaceae bacterium]